MLPSPMAPVPRRLAPALALFLLALAARPARAQDAPVRRLACGDYQLVPSGFRAEGRPSRLSIQKGGRLLETITDWTIVATECDDITADKIPELVVRSFSGGAHCCETLRVYALGEKPRLLLFYEANNAAGAEVRDINGDGRRELILGDDTFAYFDDLSYAASPASLPLIACYADGRFEDCTRQFPELLRARRAGYLGKLRPPQGEDELKDAEGNALAVVALSALLDEEEQGLRSVRAAVSDDRVVMAWLTKALPQVRDWVTSRGTKLKDKK